MKLKKVLTLALTGVLAASLLGGCGSDKKEAGNANGKVQIEYWHVASDSFGGKTVRELIKEFNEKNPNIEVKEKFNPDMYKGLTQNVQAALASGQHPDVVQMGYSFLNYANENFPHEDVNEVFKKAGMPDFMDKTFEKNVQELATANGKLIGVPYSISVPVIFYNPEIFAKAGLDPNNPPKTWEELARDAQIIHAKTGAPAFFMQEYADTWTNQAMVESNGGRILVKDGNKWKAAFNSPDGVQAYQILADMVKKGDALHATNEEGFQAFTTGKLAMVCTTIGKRANFEKSSKFKVAVATFPQFGNKELRLPAGGNFLVIMSKDKEKQKAAAKFIAFLESQDALAQWNSGTGYLPPRKNMMESGKFKEMADKNPNIKIALDSLKFVVPWVSFPGKNGLQAEQVLIDARDAILNGSQTAQQALDAAAQKIDGLLN